MSTTTYVGVFQANATRQNPGSVWVAQIARAGQLFKLGTFDTDVAAAAAFDVASRRTEAWRVRKSRYNFKDEGDAYDKLPGKFRKVVEERIEDVVKALRLIDPTAEQRYRVEEKVASVTDLDEQLTLTLQSIACQASGAVSLNNNALRAKNDKIKELQTEVDMLKRLVHERGAEIDRLNAHIEETSSLARVKIEMKRVEATPKEVISEDPDDEDES